MTQPTFITPYGYHASACGYCAPPGARSEKATSKKYGFTTSQMTVKDIIDRNWRRSGDFIYRPDITRSCCPQCAIRLDARELKPSKKDRKVINRWNRYLSTGSKDPESSSKADNGKGKGKKKEETQDWWDGLHRYEVGIGDVGVHRFETELVPAIATAETFELYKRYQVAVHEDPPAKLSMRGFKQFLCNSPLVPQPIDYKGETDLKGLPEEYGSYHLLYKVNDKIIGISVIDILPNCVSSVYFIWDPDWAWASLGKLSAMYEASLARRIWAACGVGGYLYMGYWIATCKKMRYKSEYSPSFLLDPGTNIFHPLTPALDRYLQSHKYYPFADLPDDPSGPSDAPAGDDSTMAVDDSEVEDGEEDEEDSMLYYPSPPPLGSVSLAEMTDSIIDDILLLVGGDKGSIHQLKDLRFSNPANGKRVVRELCAALGTDLVAVAGKGLEGIKDRAILMM